MDKTLTKYLAPLIDRNFISLVIFNDNDQEFKPKTSF